MENNMNREIKFRAWDIKRNEMRSPEGVLLLPKREGGAQAMSGDGYNYELMQFTGLKDKNGKEIYEGDVFREVYDDEGKTIEFVSVVKWDSSSASFFAGEPKQHFAELCDLDEIANEFEVIGNIHENPELLNP